MQRAARLLDAFIRHETGYEQPAEDKKARQYFFYSLCSKTQHWAQQKLAALLYHSTHLRLRGTDGAVRAFLYLARQEGTVDLRRAGAVLRLYPADDVDAEVLHALFDMSEETENGAMSSLAIVAKEEAVALLCGFGYCAHVDVRLGPTSTKLSTLMTFVEDVGGCNVVASVLEELEVAWGCRPSLREWLACFEPWADDSMERAGAILYNLFQWRCYRLRGSGGSEQVIHDLEDTLRPPFWAGGCGRANRMIEGARAAHMRALETLAKRVEPTSI